MPKVAGSPIRPAPNAPTAVPMFQQMKSEMPIIRKARFASSGVGCARAKAVDSSIMM